MMTRNKTREEYAKERLKNSPLKPEDISKKTGNFFELNPQNGIIEPKPNSSSSE